MEIGTANYSSGNKTTIAKIKDGDNLYRIIPPLGSMAKEGKWSRYISVEWGYKDLKGNNRPFQDVRRVNYKTKMIEVESAAFLVREQITQQFEKTLELYKAGKASQKELTEAKERKEQFNLDKKYYLNAINVKGEIVLLKVGYKAFKAMEVEIKKLQAQGIDPLSLNTGRFFNIHRSGSAFDTVYGVTVASETVEVPGFGKMQRELEHVIDATIIARLAKEATDLSTLDKLYQIVTAEEVKAMVEGGPAAVTAILGDRDNRNSNNDDGAGEQELQMTSTPVSAPAAPAASAPAAPAASAPAAPAASAPLVQAPVSAPIAAPATQTLAPVASATADVPLDREAFLKTLGL